MKKSLIAIAVGAAFAAPAAFADVTISGSINVGVEYLSVGEESDRAATLLGHSPKQLGTNNFGVASNYSNVTISSVDDIGGGNKVDFAYQIIAPVGNNSFAQNRNSHIGIVGDSWGGVWWGTNENIYERYLYSIDPLDGAAGLGGNLQIMGTPGGMVFGVSPPGNAASSPYGTSTDYGWYRRDSQSVWYDSPNWNGFTFGGVWQTNAQKNVCPNSNTCNPNMFQVGAKYASPSIPLALWGAYGRRKDEFGLTGFVGSDGTGSTDNAIQLGGSYTLGDITLFAIWEQLKYQEDGVTGTAGVASGINRWRRNAFDLGLKWNLATGYVGFQYMQAQDGKCTDIGDNTCAAIDGGKNTGAKSIGIGYYHTLSKQSQIYAVASWIDNNDLGNYGTAGIGNASSFANLGATYWGLGVGIKHSF